MGITLRKNYFYPKLINKKIIFSGTFISGNGAGNCQGSIGIATPFEMKLQGNQLEFVNLPGYKITASPNMTLQFSKNNLILQGKISINHAEISPKTLKINNALPEEVVFVGQEKPNTFSIATTVKLNLHLNDNVYIHYKELQTHLRGDLVITKNPNSPATATGMLYTSQGKYSAFGKVKIFWLRATSW